MKAWTAGEVRRIERAYSPKGGYAGFYILNSFIRHVPKNLEALLVFNRDPIILVRHDGNKQYTIVGKYNYETVPAEFRDARGQYPLPNKNYWNGSWDKDDGMVTGFPLRPWLPYPVPCTADEYQEIRHAHREETWKLKKCESPIESRFCQAFLKRGLKLVPQWKIFTATANYRVDFALPEDKIGIELDGHEFHSTKEQRTHDAQRDRALQLAGWKIIRFTGTEVYQDVDRCIDGLVKLVPIKQETKSYSKNRRSLFDF